MTAAAREAPSRSPAAGARRGQEIVLGPLCSAASVPATARLTRARGVSVIAFSTIRASPDAASINFLPKIRRQPDNYRFLRSIGKKSFAALCAGQCLRKRGGSSVRAGGRPRGTHRRPRECPPTVRRRRGRWRVAGIRGRAVRRRRRRMGRGDGGCLDGGGREFAQIQLLGTGLWDNPRVYASPVLQGGLYAAPDPSATAPSRSLPRQIRRRSRAHRNAGL